MELSALFDLKHLEAFRLVADEKHFARAAGRAFVSNATMSQRVKDFETAIGYEVFHRTSRSVELTPRGERLLALIAGPMAELELAFQQGSSLDRQSREIAIAVVSDTDTGRVLAAINRLRTVYASVRTERVNDHQLAGLFEQGAIQAATSWSSLELLGLDVGAYRSAIVDSPRLICVVAAGDPLSQRTSISIGDVLGRQVVLFHREIAPGAYDVITTFLRSSGAEPALIAPQHSQTSMADAIDWNPGAITFGSEPNLPHLPERFVGIPVEGVVTPSYIHAPREWSSLVDEVVRYVGEF